MGNIGQEPGVLSEKDLSTEEKWIELHFSGLTTGISFLSYVCLQNIFIFKIKIRL